MINVPSSRSSMFCEIIADDGLLRAYAKDKKGWRRDPIDQFSTYPYACSHPDPQPLTLFNQARVPAVFKNAVMASLEHDVGISPSHRRAVQWLAKWSQTNPLPAQGILLSGPPGVGKSFAMAALVRRLTLERAIPALFLDFGQFLLQLKDCYNTAKNEYRLFEEVQQVTVLVLDDVGAGRDTEWSREVLKTIVTRRYNAMSLTLVTTNLAISSSSERGDCAFLKSVGPHCFSRLKEMCYWLIVDGPDRRQSCLSHNAAF